jgi:hypothetical protein
VSKPVYQSGKSVELHNVVTHIENVVEQKKALFQAFLGIKESLQLYLALGRHGIEPLYVDGSTPCYKTE